MLLLMSALMPKMKIFINMCGSDKVAAPGSWEEGKIPDNIAEKLDKAHIAPDESLR